MKKIKDIQAGFLLPPVVPALLTTTITTTTITFSTTLKLPKIFTYNFYNK